MKRVVVTGMGVVSPIGNEVKTFGENLMAGVHGIGPITRFDTTDYKATLAAEVKDFNCDHLISKKDSRRFDLFSKYAMVAADEAYQMSGLGNADFDHDRAGVYIGSGIGGMITFEDGLRDLDAKGPRRVSPFLIPAMISNMATGQVALHYGLRGPSLPVVTACATSTNAIGEAYRNIKHGYSDVILAGGAEGAITDIGIAGFIACMALTNTTDPDRASIPFDLERSGFVMGEGAAVLVLEEMDHAIKRGAHILAEVVGYGNTCDAYHMTAPDPEALGSARAICLSVEEAGGVDIDKTYYNAHGTSTGLNDKTETLALKKAFGDDAYKLSISSTKSMTGHMLGAAGAVEAIAGILALAQNKVPPTVGLKVADPDCDLDYTPNVAKEKELEFVVSASLGFGGHNASIVLRKYHHGK